MEPSQVSTMARADLERLVLERPEVGLKIMGLLSERLRRYEARLEDVTMKDVRSRLAGIIVLLVESESVRNGAAYKIPSHYMHEHLGTYLSCRRNIYVG
jgi:CRP/FNR family cyclic AMP-dependent transcriptional regulator